MTIRSLGDWIPVIAGNAFVAPNAEVMGQVTLHEGCGIWYGCVLRGDLEPIIVGAYTNIQDLSVIHTDRGHPAIIGQRVTVGHQACIHGARIGDGCLIGMGATVLTGAIVGPGCIIGAGALVSEGMEIPAGVLAVGVPCKVRRDLSPEERDNLLAHADRYADYARKHMFWLGSDPPKLSL